MQKTKLTDFPLYFWANSFVKSKSNVRCDINSEWSKIDLDHIIYTSKHSGGECCYDFFKKLNFEPPYQKVMIKHLEIKMVRGHKLVDGDVEFSMSE